MTITTVSRTPSTPPQGTASLQLKATMTTREAHAAGKLGTADIHMHSTYSDGTGTIAQILDYTQNQTILNVIAITDHDNIDGSLRARDLWARGYNNNGGGQYRFDFIVGEEISTRDGHLLALFVERLIPPGLSMERSIDLIHEQNGIAIIAHPFHRIFRSISCQPETLDRVCASRDTWIDGIETWNASFCGFHSNGTIMQANRTHYYLSELGNSDAHSPISIGCGFTWFDGRSAADLRCNIEQGTTAPGGKMWGLRAYKHWAVHKFSRKRTSAPIAAAPSIS